MASSKIKGITIVIDGQTDKLQNALKDVDKQVYSLNSDLKALNQALKLDPSNTELLAQKHEVLARNIEATKSRLDTLKEAQRQMGDYNKLTDEQKTSYNQLSLEIAKSESALKSMNTELKNTSKLDFAKLKDGLQKVGEVALNVSKKMVEVGAALGTAITGMVTAGVKSYAELEKAQEGSKRLFEDAYDSVAENAKQAYKTMGISATEYYDQVNTYAVGLKEALGGNTREAAKLANDILIAQADIVAATGASQETVQNAFSAIMRGNYTMIDNLRLGIKGSKQGMQEVIKKVNEWNKAQGKATNYQMDNLADLQKALIDYTKMTGVAGTASEQLSATINGSVSQMKAAFDNFLNGSGSPEELSKSLINLMRNILKALRNLAPNIISGIVTLFNELIPELVSMGGELMPIILKGVSSLFDGIISFINKDTSQFLEMAVDILVNIVNFITQNLPLIIEASVKIITQLATGLSQAMPKLIPTIVDMMILIVEAIINNLPLIITAGVKIILNLATGIINAIPDLLSKVPQVMIKAADKMAEYLPAFVSLGGQIIDGIWQGIKLKWTILTTNIGHSFASLVGYLRNLLGIHSPSKVMRDQIGVNIGLGIAEGINDTVGDVKNAMSNLTNEVEASVNPTINPTANSNPLYISIDKFYNNREADIAQLAEELEFYRKNSALAKGGV